MRMRMLRSLASAAAGRVHILPISALGRTLFTPTTHHERVLHSLVSKPAEQMRILPISAPLRTLCTLSHEPCMPTNMPLALSNSFPKSETLEKPVRIVMDMATSGDGAEEETHSPKLYGEPLLINKGDDVNLQQLLFTRERNFLMKSNGQKVEIDGFSKNYVLLYIFPLVDDHKIALITRELVELRNLLLDKGCFEIVSVGLGSVGLGSTDLSKQRKYFEEYSSQMTWPFIPYEDHDARERVRSTFGFSQRFVAGNGGNYPYCGIVHPNGKILQSWAWDILNYYGHDAFPFTDDKIFFLYKEEASMLAEGVSLNALLGTSNRDYVLSPKGDKVPIQDLENKVVCIILDDPIAAQMHTIEDIFASIKLDAHRDFVPVYVCRHFTNTVCCPDYIHIKDKAKKICESVRWLRIPYGDSSARKIWRVILSRCKRNGRLGTLCNVVGPRGSYVDFYALYHMISYGRESYPFTTRQVAELKAQELQAKFRLEDVLQPTCQINRDGGLKVILHPKCKVSCYCPDGDGLVLYNKRILVLLGTHSVCRDETRGPDCHRYLCKFLSELRMLYVSKKQTNEGFEVIYLSFDCLRSDYDKSVYMMPWVSIPFGKEEVANKLRICGYPWPLCGNIPAILAFERDGVLVGMEANVHLKKDIRMHFPYVNSVADELIKINQQFLDDDIPKGDDLWRSF